MYNTTIEGERSVNRKMEAQPEELERRTVLLYMAGTSPLIN